MERGVAFELEVNESVEAGVRRIVDEQLENALDELRSAEARKADEAVHSARKRFKRIRALLRLVRAELGEQVFTRENATYRDAGGSLAEARDAHVLVETLDDLKDDLDEAAYAAARKLLMNRRRIVKRRVLQQGSGLEVVAGVIDDARQRIPNWRIARDGWNALRRGLKRIYAEGRGALGCAHVGAEAVLFHEWRKRVKDLWHQVEVIEAIWPPILKELAEECHHLADLLGKEHDLSVLREVLLADALAKALAKEHVGASVIESIDRRRAKLQHEALTLGQCVFAEKSGAFIKRLGRYWTAWKSAGATQTKPEPTVALTPVQEVIEEGTDTTGVSDIPPTDNPGDASESSAA